MSQLVQASNMSQNMSEAIKQITLRLYSAV